MIRALPEAGVERRGLLCTRFVCTKGRGVVQGESVSERVVAWIQRKCGLPIYGFYAETVAKEEGLPIAAVRAHLDEMVMAGGLVIRKKGRSSARGATRIASFQTPRTPKTKFVYGAAGSWTLVAQSRCTASGGRADIMARVEMRPADLDHIPCLFCGVMSFPDGSSPRKYTIFHGQHRLTEVFAICDECAVELAGALAMGERMGSDQYLVGRQARQIRALLYRLTSARQALADGGEATERATQDLLESIPAQADEIAKALENGPIVKKGDDIS